MRRISAYLRTLPRRTHGCHGFTLYNKLLTCNPVGKIAIWNSLIPVVGAVTSCLCLNEEFKWKYAVAATLTTIGIYLINKGKK